MWAARETMYREDTKPSVGCTEVFNKYKLFLKYISVALNSTLFTSQVAYLCLLEYFYITAIHSLSVMAKIAKFLLWDVPPTPTLDSLGWLPLTCWDPIQASLPFRSLPWSSQGYRLPSLSIYYTLLWHRPGQSAYANHYLISLSSPKSVAPHQQK